MNSAIMELEEQDIELQLREIDYCRICGEVMEENSFWELECPNCGYREDLE